MQSLKGRRQWWVEAALLGLVLMVAAGLRLRGLEWDSNQHLHPDERFLTMVAASLEPVDSVGHYLDTSRSTLNPTNVGSHPDYVYGTFPVILTRLIGGLIGSTDYSTIHLVGRRLSALCDLLVVLLVFVLGRRCGGPAVGLLAAALSALTVLQIQQSHFFTVDNFANLFLTAALVVAVVIAEQHSQRSGRRRLLALATLFGLAAGAAVAAKLNALPIVLALPAALLIRYLARRATAQGESIRDSLLALAVGALGAAVLFRLLMPYAFSGPGLFDIVPDADWLQSIGDLMVLSGVDADWPPAMQWARRSVFFAFENMVLWGMGLPLGVLAWTGFGCAALSLRRRRLQPLLLPWAWVALYFGWQSLAANPTMRYLLPVYPPLAVLAGWVPVAIWRCGRGGRLRWRWAAVAIAATTILATLAWAVAFSSIYARPVTRIAASEWIYDTIPAGSAIANESSWDDALPLLLPGFGHRDRLYQMDLNLELYHPDDASKLERMVTTLDRADLVVISSSRQWASLSRIEERFPLTTAYYRHLAGCPDDLSIELCFNRARPGSWQGRLGFDLVRTFTSDPRLGPFTCNDQAAEEAFTVYDHPKVLLFAKSDTYRPKLVRDRLAAVDLDHVVALKPGRAPPHPADLLLPEARLQGQRAGGTYSELFNRRALVNSSGLAATMSWYLLVSLLGWSAYLLLRPVLGGLPDHGFAFCRLFGLLLLAYPVWLAGSCGVSTGRGLIAAVLAGLTVAAAIVARRDRAQLAEDWRRRHRHLITLEGLTALLFLLGLGVRCLNPDLWHPWMGGEKPMDLAYLSAVLKSSTFPPFDPWFAGGYINYYYWGWVLVGTPVKLLGLIPTTAYNLILPTLFAVTGCAAFGLASNLVAGNGRSDRRWPTTARAAGIASTLATVILGNLASARMILNGCKAVGAPEDGAATLFARCAWTIRGAVRALGGAELPYRPSDWYWNPTRIISDPEVTPITEFPAFTFLYGDLHAHLVDLPLLLLVLAWMVAVVRTLATPELRISRLRLGALVTLGGLSVGALRAVNTWSFYPMLSLAVVTLVWAAWRSLEGRRNSVRMALATSHGAVLIALAYLLFAPWARWYGQAYGHIGPWRGATTSIEIYLIHWGLFLFVVASWIAVELRQRWADLTRLVSAHRVVSALLIAALVTAIVGLSARGVAVAVPVLVLAAAAALLLARRDLHPSRRLVLLWITAALGLTLMVELVVLDGDIGRMNTVFKFYLQAWMLLAVAAAAALAWTWQAAAAWTRRRRRAWLAALAFLVAAAALYPLLAVPARVGDRIDPSAPRGLDGTAYMTGATYSDAEGHYHLDQDRGAIRWLQDNVSGSPVIVEAHTPEYRWGSRISIYTGLPTVLGWNWHQRQQRATIPAHWIWNRADAIRDFYTTASTATARAFLDRFEVRYIILGELERAYYPGPGLTKFPALDGVLWHSVYQDREMVIYEVKRESR